MNLPIDFHPRLNTQDVLNKLSLGPARRILLDKSGESNVLHSPISTIWSRITRSRRARRRRKAYMSLRR